MDGDERRVVDECIEREAVRAGVRDDFVSEKAQGVMQRNISVTLAERDFPVDKSVEIDIAGWRVYEGASNDFE